MPESDQEGDISVPPDVWPPPIYHTAPEPVIVPMRLGFKLAFPGMLVYSALFTAIVFAALEIWTHELTGIGDIVGFGGLFLVCGVFNSLIHYACVRKFWHWCAARGIRRARNITAISLLSFLLQTFLWIGGH